MSRIVECVPNFSEARRPEVVVQIRSAIAAIAGVTFLDQHSDVDHNRTVLTFVGEPAVVEQAAFDAIKIAAQLIDLDHHTGEHPRIGATDVVPFVPISGVTLEECVAMAKRVGERVGSELNIPVYLYEAAAARPDRENLENIRRGQYEGLKTEIETNPNRLPDYGPAKIGPAGATVIGARSFLIAFNVYLNTGDVEIAKQIAKAVRHSSGGLRYVKAAGFLVEGQAQVSMNLTNYRKTPIARVVETIRREAARHGCAITKSELVGLTPQDALIDAAQWYLQLDMFESHQILENKLREALSGQPKSIVPHAFIEATAAGSATPGGGAVAALAGALSAALAGMVARLSIGKKKYASVEAQM
ncbi:MAG: glutamate formimidoyltransferase, partial [Chloroflexi bacterium]|nr:glutamate formimidoyltransferase [Chloroflexota bacterium]